MAVETESPVSFEDKLGENEAPDPCKSGLFPERLRRFATSAIVWNTKLNEWNANLTVRFNGRRNLPLYLLKETNQAENGEA